MLPRTLNAILTLLMYHYEHRPDDNNTMIGTLAREVRANRNANNPNQTFDANLLANVQDAAYTAMDENDPRTIADIIKEVAGAKVAKSNETERTLIDALVAILYLPRPANYLTLPSIQAIQEALLRPDEMTQARLTEMSKASRCYRCGTQLRDGEAVTYHSPEYSGDAGSLVICAGCEPPVWVKCANTECDNRMGYRKGEVQFCHEHDGSTKTAQKKAATPREMRIAQEVEAFRDAIRNPAQVPRPRFRGNPVPAQPPGIRMDGIPAPAAVPTPVAPPVVAQIRNENQAIMWDAPPNIVFQDMDDLLDDDLEDVLDEDRDEEIE